MKRVFAIVIALATSCGHDFTIVDDNDQTPRGPVQGKPIGFVGQSTFAAAGTRVVAGFSWSMRVCSQAKVCVQGGFIP